MDKTRKKRIKSIVSWCCIGALVVVLATMPMLAAQEAGSDGPEATIRTAQAEQGIVERSLHLGGTLAAQEAEELTLPSGVKLKRFLVSNGEHVQAGQALAEVDPVSVMEAITQIQDTLDYLDDQINDVDTSTGTLRLKAQTAGTVKQIFVKKGDSVQQVMLEHGALAILSLDGSMAVDITSEESLTIGQELTVTLETGETVTSRVESRLGNTFIITLEDKGYAPDITATVTDEDGNTLGSGPLYIHNPWKVTAVSGTVSAVSVSENQSVTQGRQLLTLTDTDTDAQRQMLLGQRQDYEDVMQTLFQMYRSGTLDAPCDGTVDGVDEESPLLLAAEEGSWTVMLLSNEGEGDGGTDDQGQGQGDNQDNNTGGQGNDNNQGNNGTGGDQGDGGTGDQGGTGDSGTGDGGQGGTGDGGEGGEGGQDPAPQPTTYTGIVAMITAGENGGLVFLTNGATVTTTDPGSLTANPAELTQPTTFGGSMYLYIFSEENLLLTATPATAGQLVFITEGKLVSLGSVSAGSGSLPSGGDMSAMFSGGMSGFGGQGSITPSFEPYDLTETTVLTVTPEDSLTLDVPVDEQDISQISLGMDAVVTVTALGGETYPAQVTKIGVATNSGGNSKFTVTLTMAKGEKMLVGMSASAVVPLDDGTQCLVVPTAAIYDDGVSTFVYTAQEEKTGQLTSPVTVTIGLSDGENTQILSGLEAGTPVYYAYYEAQ